jgi:hypothetical protein
MLMAAAGMEAMVGIEVMAGMEWVGVAPGIAKAIGRVVSFITDAGIRQLTNGLAATNEIKMIIRIIVIGFGFVVYMQETAFWKHHHYPNSDNDQRRLSDPEGWSWQDQRWYPHHRCWSEDEQWHTCYDKKKND